MKKELLDLDVSSIQDKQYLSDIIEFWLHCFLLRIAKYDLDSDDVYKLASDMVIFRKRVVHNKSKVEITSTFQLLLLIDVIDAFLDSTISHKTGQVNNQYIHSLDEIGSILKFNEVLIKFDSQFIKQYPLDKDEAKVISSISNIIFSVEQKDMDFFDSKCNGKLQVHFR